MISYVYVEVSPVCVDPGVPRIKLVTVNDVAAEIVYVNSPSVVEPLAAIRCRWILSVVAMFVFAMVCVPDVRVPVPIKSVTAPPLILSCFAEPLMRTFPAVAARSVPAVSVVVVVAEPGKVTADGRESVIRADEDVPVDVI